SRETFLGYGWNMFSRMFSPGGDVLYGVRPDNGDMLWYRYVESTGQLISDPSTGLGKLVGTGWQNDTSTVATTDSCSLTNEPNPDRPQVPLDRTAKAALVKTKNGYLQYSYVDGEGRLVHSEVRDLFNVNPNGFGAIPGYNGLTGSPSIGESANGLLRIYGQGTDSDTRGVTQTALNGPWGAFEQQAGRMFSASQFVRTSNERLTLLALDDAGALWTKSQKTTDGQIFPWQKANQTGTLPGGATRHLTAVASGDAIVLGALSLDGVYRVATLTNGSLSAWVSTSGNGGIGAASMVVMPDNTVQVFVRRADGRVYGQRSRTDGTFAGTWTAVLADLAPGVTAAGAPSALMAPNGALQVAVRGTDGFVYRTGQVSPGSTGWLPWAEITEYTEETGVDPTLSLAADTWVIAFRTPDGDPKLRRFQAGSAKAASTNRTSDTSSTSSGFVDVPLTAPDK
ncbi:MAG: tachylectin-related carbohydrate-binding protein, partial [Umezawaea sp.]